KRGAPGQERAGRPVEGEAMSPQPSVTAALAHDLKNRLAVLAQELMSISPEQLRPETRSHLASARAQAEVSLRSLTNFLVVSKADAGVLRCSAEQESLEDLVLEVAQRAQVF